MVQLRDVEVRDLSLSVFGPLIGTDRLARLDSAAATSRVLLDGRVVWNVNSTASGGGVAEMLRTLVGYIRGAGIDARWVVIEGDPHFFAITKRVHNRIHGLPGDAGALGPAESAHYVEVSAANASALLERLHGNDIVLLHDPQTAGMAPWLHDAGAKVIWRSHIGADTTNEWTDQTWAFLRPFLDACDAFVFTRQPYVPAWMPADMVSIIPPSIDPFSPKNQAITDTDVPYFLARIGLTSGPVDRAPTYTRTDGTSGTVDHQATIVCEGGALETTANMVLQVSRWDRLKDMSGVLSGFASHLAGRVDAHLVLAGPAVEGVVDDPEGAVVLGECIEAWEALPTRQRRRITLLSLPMNDIEENAIMVNALQRSATVIVQKSLAEGFGLTVAEGMWKGKPLVASRVGGIIDQVTPGTGILLDDPTDIDAFGAVLASLLERPDEIRRLGVNAHQRVLDAFVGDQHLLQYAALIERLVLA